MEWKKISERTEKVGYKKVTLKDFEMPDGQVSEFTTWGTATQNVAVIALTPDNRVVIARQFRPGPERIFDELPGGGVEEGEDYAVAAARELLEETGYAAATIESLGTACRDAYTNETNNYFIAYNCEQKSGQSLDDNEHVTIATISINELIKNAVTAKMSDSVAVLMAYEKLQALIA